MDILKQCTTNVQELRGLPDIHVALYEREASSLYRRNDEGISAMLAQLRASGVHCTLPHGRSKGATGAEVPVDAMQLCLFGSCDPSLAASILSLGFTLYLEGPFGDTAEAELLNGATVEEEVLRAIEATITHDLWQTQRGTKVGHCTWLMSDLLQNSGPIVRLDIAWSDVDAHIVIASVTTSTDKRYHPVCAANSARSPETDVMLASGGTQAVLKFVDNTVTQPVQSEDWQFAVREALALEGIDIEADADWIEVMTKDLDIMLWPAALTFAQSHADEFVLSSDVQGSEPLDEAPGDNALLYNDLLSDAEQWFNDTIVRQRGPLTDHDSDDDVALHAVYDASGNAGGVFDFLSPQMMQRPETHAAGLLYPTPPDGMANFQQSQQTPNVTSTPVTQLAGLLPDGPQASGSGANGEDVGGPEHVDTRPRGPSIASSVGATHIYAGHHEDLFGDLGGDEVDEEDFSFFDEPDDMRVMGSETIPMKDADVLMSEHRDDDDRLSPDAGPLGTGSAFEVEEPKGSSLQDTMVIASVAAHDTDTAMTIDVGHAPGGGNGESLSSDTETPRPHAVILDHRPLSPLTIKEQLLPQPVPASAPTDQLHNTAARKKGSFAPLEFGQRQKNNASARLSLLSDSGQCGSSSKSARPASTSMRGMLRQSDSTDESSETDDMETVMHQEAANGPQTSRKRKRSALLEFAVTVTNPSDWVARLPMFNQTASDHKYLQDLRRKAQDMTATACSAFGGVDQLVRHKRKHPQGLWDDYNSQDMVMISQVLAEQAITTTHSIVDDLQVLRIDGIPPDSASASTAADTVLGLLNSIVPATKPSDLTTLVMTRELPSRPTPVTTTTAKVPGQPRPPPPRHDATSTTGPDVQSLTIPYMRVTRAGDTLELLPTAMPFWDALGLGPVSRAKNVGYYCVAPNSDHLGDSIEAFMQNLSQVYEGCNLGQHRAVGATDESVPAARWQWLLSVDCVANAAARNTRSKTASLEATWPQYREAMGDLGGVLADSAHDEPATTKVIYLIDAFSSENMDARPALCAAFYSAYQLYVAALAQNAVEDGARKPASDVVLQILPMNLIYRPHELVIPTSAHMASLAREVYDRLPPAASQKAASADAINFVTTSPCVHLAPTIPKRVNFQLLAEPPHDLLHEGSVLHLAYGFTADKHWLAVHWTDAAGMFADSVVLSMRGRSVAATFEQVWSRTLSALDRKQIPWKVCITRAMPRFHVPAWEAQCWHDVVGETKRKQVTSVTLLAIDLDPAVQFTPPETIDGESSDAVASAGAFLTPVSTPQAGGTMTGASVMTVSPTADSITAPPTPAPSESTAAAPEKDAEGHLVDLEAETWSLLLDRCKIPRRSAPDNITTASILACGQLIKRGDPTSAAQSHFPAIGADLLWTIQIRAAGAGIVEGNAKHAEGMLREVLGTWRGLGCLAKLRGLQLAESLNGLVPIHVVGAVQAARALEWMP
ncbi:mediator of RNA polymerase II transcription subunit 13 [Oleoguttula sp. CCFEE 5521]